MGLNQEFISPKEVAERYPLIDPCHYHAALWDDQDGDLDPSGATYAFAKAARVHGAQYLTHTPVTGTTQRPDASWDVQTAKGNNKCRVYRKLWRTMGPRSRAHAGHQPSSSTNGASLSFDGKDRRRGKPSNPPALWN